MWTSFLRSLLLYLALHLSSTCRQCIITLLNRNILCNMWHLSLSWKCCSPLVEQASLFCEHFNLLSLLSSWSSYMPYLNTSLQVVLLLWQLSWAYLCKTVLSLPQIWIFQPMLGSASGWCSSTTLLMLLEAVSVCCIVKKLVKLFVKRLLYKILWLMICTWVHQPASQPASLVLFGDLLKVVSFLSKKKKKFDYLCLFANGLQVEKESMLLLTCSINTSENA